MAQPTFSPVPQSGEVRPTMPTAVPEIGRPPKPGLLRSVHRADGPGAGTPAPDEGYALTVAAREVAKLDFAQRHDREDVALGVGLVAAKRASLIGRGPTLGDVRVAMAHFGLVEGVTVTRELSAPFLGLAHSYAAQRRFVDAVAPSELLDGAPATP